MAGSSKKKPKKVINMQLTPASKLQHSASSLSDPEFNPSGLGRLDITDKGLEITVRNTQTQVLANLHLKPPGLTNFLCKKPIVGKIVDVATLFIFVSGATHDNDTVNIFHLHGSNKLTFVLESDLDEKFDLELLDMDAEIEGFPNVALFSEAALTCNYLMEMIEQLEEPGINPQVYVSIEELRVTYIIGRSVWFSKFGQDGIVGTRGMQPGQIHRAAFVMPHLQAMKDASCVTRTGLVVSLLKEPADSVMMRFGLDVYNTLGDLVFIYKARRIEPNCQDKNKTGSEEVPSSSAEVKVSESEEQLNEVGKSDSLDESSDQIPEKVMNLQLKPASKLLNSAFALANKEFNPTGMGRVDITEKGFEITVRNTETGVVGYLYLNSSELIDFHCSKPIVGKIIDLDNIFLVVVGIIQDDETVTIFHLDGSNNLTFILGNDPDEEYKVTLFEMDPEIERIPFIRSYCETVCTSDVLLKMISHLEETEVTQQVSVNIAEKLVTYIIGKKAWVFKYEGDQLVGTTGAEPGKIHRAWFILHHLESMSHASSLGPYLVMHILLHPADTVMIRFCFQELGYLVFIYNTEYIAVRCPEETGSSDSHEEIGSDSEVIVLPPDQPLQVLEFTFR